MTRKLDVDINNNMDVDMDVNTLGHRRNSSVSDCSDISLFRYLVMGSSTITSLLRYTTCYVLVNRNVTLYL
jgi:hypothetical protein